MKQMIRCGQQLPEAWLNVPKLNKGLEFYLMAYFDLDRERAVGLSVGPIPWSAVMDYATAYELDERQRSDLLFIIKYMDAENMKRMREKQKKDNG